jgi:hypothetical protein
MHTIHHQTICALISLQGFINNEIARHRSNHDEFLGEYWLKELAKIESLEAFHYQQFQSSRLGGAA